MDIGTLQTLTLDICAAYDCPPVALAAVDLSPKDALGEYHHYGAGADIIYLDYRAGITLDTALHEAAHHITAHKVSHPSYCDSHCVHWQGWYRHLSDLYNRPNAPETHTEARGGRKVPALALAVYGGATAGLAGITYAGIAWLGGQIPAFGSGIAGALQLAAQAF